VALVVLLITTSILTFLVFFAGPADPASNACGKGCTPQRIADARVALGLNKSLVVQYWEFFKGLFVGRDFGAGASFVHCSAPCFGRSFQTQAFVTNTIKQAFPYTFSIALGGAVIWLTFGVAFGILAALRKNTWVDRSTVTASVVGLSLPTPLIGYGLIYLFVVKWNVLPYTSNAITAPWSAGGPWAWVKNFMLPWLTIALITGAAYVRLTRANMIETMGEDYIRTARAKGLPRRTVVYKHALRAAITPIVTIFGLDLGLLFGGAVFTETIFGVPGLGRTAVTAVSNDDLPLTMGIVLFAAFFIILANIIVDILYAVIDPRVRLA
jgi:peptide/nickel transport system permease protein